ncbi:MAG TPA: hypothetical protein P5205_01630 [Candidatus Paceibacterota bacterium]|nr:hypothetical protein [Verrucomicrobiota bacterium]HSA09046.1 hypothetical protein [Candidatus Paceibacterota bacterium]
MRIRLKGEPAGDPPASGLRPAGTPPAPTLPRPRKARHFSWRPSWPGILHLLVLWAIVVVVWGLAHDRLSPGSWKVPLNYSGDSLQMLTWIRGASEFEYVPFASRANSRLGAPYHANWDDYPMYEPVVTFLVGMAARCTDLATGSNWGILASFLASAASFYVCCRMLRWRREWAAAGALLFAFSYYHTWRGLGHLLLSYDYTVPLAIMGVWLLTAGKRLRLGDRVFWLCAGTALLLGMGNPYNLSMWLQFLGLGLAVRYLLQRRKSDLAIGLVIVAVAALGFLAVNAHNIFYQMAHGENQLAVPRPYKQLELYALKPLELVLPPWQHRLAWLGDISREYAAAAWVQGEMFSPYLGVVGLGALAWLAIEFGLRALNLRKAPRRLPSHAPLCLWVTLYSAVGGLNCLLGLAFGILYFRGSNRYSIFISAIVLFFLVSRMSRLVRGWSRAASYALAAGVAGIGLLDQLPPPSKEANEAVARAVQNDQAFCLALEETLPPRAMIFQLPLMNFIDGDPIGDMHAYEHMRPYLWTRHLRFSSGSVQGRRREDWQEQIAAMPIAQAARELERLGFAGLYFNRKAYTDRAEAMLRELAKSGRGQLIEDEAREQVCVVLTPSPQPAWPHSDDAAQIAYKGNWSFGSYGLRDRGNLPAWWACDRKASLYFVSEHPEPCSFHLTAIVAVASPRRVDIEFQGRTVWSRQLEPGESQLLDLRLLARPGRNYLRFINDRQVEPPVGQPHAVRVAQCLIDLQIVKER